MDKDGGSRPTAQTLFRQPAMQAASQRLFGTVVVAMPPSAMAAVALGLVAAVSLAGAAVFVEVPQRAQAVGVLMPPEGFLDVVAAESGQVGTVLVSDGERVAAGQLLLRVTQSGANTKGEPRSAAQLDSLRTELELLEQIAARHERLAAERLAGLQEEMAAAHLRLRLGRQQQAARSGEVSIVKERFARLSQLARDGHISGDALDRERLSLAAAVADGAELEQRLVALEAEPQRLLRRAEEIRQEAALQSAEHELRAEQLRRNLEQGAYLAAQGIRAPVDGVVARVLVSAGAAVSRGQVLAKVVQADGQLEAWLYLSSSRARLLRRGQRVELQLDAWPSTVFGTRSATVSAVSAIALAPSEVPVPLNLAGPVFEIRAALDRQPIRAYDSEWPVAPGTTFRAQILQRELRLYQWLAKKVSGESKDGNA